MMKKKILFGASFFVVAAVLLVACYEELDVKRSEKSGFLTYEEEVTAAREFYEAMKPSKTRAKADLTTESGMIANMEPLWGKKFAYRRKNKNIRTVEAVMEGSKQITFMLPEVLKKYKETGDSRYKKSMTRLVVETDAETGEKQAFTMTIVPDLDYLERTDFKPFYNTYVQRDKHFSGLILFHELDGFFANGWRYKDGKITHSIEGTTFSQEEIEQYKAQTRATKEECGWVEYYQLVEECRVWCYKTEYTDETCEETEDCYRYWEYVESKWECKTVEVPDGNPSYIPPTDTKKYAVPPGLTKFFRENGIGADISRLDELYQEMLDKCYYSQIGAYMEEIGFQMRGVRYNSNLSIGTPSSVSSGAYLNFKDKSVLNISTIEHEFFHMYQYAYGDYHFCTDEDKRTAREFERQVFEDIAACIRIKGNFETYIDHRWGYNGFPANECGEYQDWLNDITDNGKKFPSELTSDEYKKFLSYYYEYDVAYGKRAGKTCEVSNFNTECIDYILGLVNSGCE